MLGKLVVLCKNDLANTIVEWKSLKRLILFFIGINDNIYHEVTVSKMPDFDKFSRLEVRKHISRSHGIRKMEMANENSAL